MTRSPGSTILALLAVAAACSPHPRSPPRDRQPSPSAPPAPDFDLPGIDGKRYSLADFADDEVLVARLHREPLPDRPGLRGPHPEAPRGASPRAACASSSSRPTTPSRCASTSRATPTSGDTLEDMKIRAPRPGVHLPLPLRRRDPGDVPGVRAEGHPPRLRLRPRSGRCGSWAASTTTRTRRRPPPPTPATRSRRSWPGARSPVETTKVFGCSIKWSDKRAWVKKGYEDWAKEPVDPRDDRHRGRSRLWSATTRTSSGSSTSGPRGAARA